MRKLLFVLAIAVSRFSNSVIGLGIILLVAQPTSGSTDEVLKRYFPDGAWSKPTGAWTQAEQAQFYENWFGGQLAAMGEPSLAFGDRSERGPNEIRLLYLPTFNPGAMLRIWFSDEGEVPFEFKKLSGAGGYVPGDLIVHKTGTTNKSEAAKIFELLDEITPWDDDVASFVRRGYCKDGARFIFEFREGDAYKAIQRHECDLPTDLNISRLIFAFNDISDGQLVDPNTLGERQ